MVADPDIARYIHLAIRNPDPRKFVWTWYVDTWQYVYNASAALNTTQLIVVTNEKPENTTCPTDHLTKRTTCRRYIT
ncbi:MAG: hypothetical protein QXU93_07255 [Thermoproteus sp.]